MSTLHDRMPVMLVSKEFSELDPSNRNTNALKDLLRPFPDDGIKYYQVDQAVGKVKNNSANLLTKVN